MPLPRLSTWCPSGHDGPRPLIPIVMLLKLLKCIWTLTLVLNLWQMINLSHLKMFIWTSDHQTLKDSDKNCQNFELVPWWPEGHQVRLTLFINIIVNSMWGQGNIWVVLPAYMSKPIAHWHYKDKYCVSEKVKQILHKIGGLLITESAFFGNEQHLIMCIIAHHQASQLRFELYQKGAP